MKIIIKRENFSIIHYDLQIKETALDFLGEEDSFSLQYFQIMDFVITQDQHGKFYFTMMAVGRCYEGMILDAQDIKSFATALKEKLSGVINIEIRRN